MLANVRTQFHRASLGLGLCALAACHAPEPDLTDALDAGDASAHHGAATDGGGRADASTADAYVHVGYAGQPRFCERPGADAVRDLFCGQAPPTIGSLRALQSFLRLNPVADPASPSQGPYQSDAPSASSYDAGAVHSGDAGDAGDAGNVKDAGYAAAAADASATGAYGEPVADADNTLVDNVVFLGHSTALSGHLVSPINPRVLVLGLNTVMAYQLGVQQIEIVSSSRETAQFDFYLLNFLQACNTSEHGCSAGDLFTPRVESNWVSVSIRDDEELKNTPLDCRQCHQRGEQVPGLLMRELVGPWTHFFEPAPVGAPDYGLPGVRGRDLVEDYVRAKGNESYAGINAATVRHTLGLVLENLAGTNQPLFFDAANIELERWPFDGERYAKEPLPSPTWDAAYEAFKRGEQLALPYVEPRATDPGKQARLTQAYQAYRAGTLPAEQLPDLSDIFPDDPLVRAKIGLVTEPDATPAQALIQACGSCHNDVLDQSISRARFNIDLSRMTSAELELAIQRMQLTPEEPFVMPPPEGRQLDAAAREALIAYLKSGARSADDDAMLARAAKLGMAGGRRR